MRGFSEYPEHAVLGMINDLDDTAAMTDAVVFLDVLPFLTRATLVMCASTSRMWTMPRGSSSVSE